MTNEVMAMPKVEYKQGVIDFENYGVTHVITYKN